MEELRLRNNTQTVAEVWLILQHVYLLFTSRSKKRIKKHAHIYDTNTSIPSAKQAKELYQFKNIKLQNCLFQLEWILF